MKQQYTNLHENSNKEKTKYSREWENNSTILKIKYNSDSQIY